MPARARADPPASGPAPAGNPCRASNPQSWPQGIIVVDLHRDLAGKEWIKLAASKQAGTKTSADTFTGKRCLERVHLAHAAKVIVDVGHEAQRTNDGRRIHCDARPVRAEQLASGLPCIEIKPAVPETGGKTEPLDTAGFVTRRAEDRQTVGVIAELLPRAEADCRRHPPVLPVEEYSS